MARLAWISEVMFSLMVGHSFPVFMTFTFVPTSVLMDLFLTNAIYL